MAQKTKTVDKWKRKKWYKVFAPQEFDKKELGETPAEKPELVVGRTIKANARTLSNQPKKGHLDLWFKILDVQGLNAYTKIFGLEVKPATMKRVVRRRSSKIDAVKDLETKDKVAARIKISVVSQRKIPRIKETAIRLKVIEELEKAVKQYNYPELVMESAFGNTLPNNLYKALKNIAGVKRIEVMKIQQLHKKGS